MRESRVEEVAQGVADEVDGEDGEHHGQGREEHEMRRIEKVRAGVVEHGSPAGGWRGDAEAEEAHGGFGENGSGHADSRLHDDGLNDVGQDVARNNVEIASAESASGFDKFALADREHLRTDQAGVADPASERQSEHQIEDAGTAEGDEGDGDENAGEGKKGIHQHDIGEAVDGAAVITGKTADDEAEQKGTGDDAAADEERNTRAPDEAGEDVAAEFIGAAPMLRGGRLEAVGEIDVRRILGGDPGSEEGGEGEDGDEDHPDGRQWIMASDARERDR